MTALVVVEMQQALDEILTITEEDIDPYKGTGSRLAIGTTLTRGEALELALMASENRAANVLGRSFPGGLAAFVEAMNSRARALGMVDTNYVEPTGLSYKNKSSAKDLAALVKAAYDVPIIREYSVATHKALTLQSGRVVHFGTTNRLVKSRDWEIGLQKTGFIREAGLCLVMQAHISGRKLIMVLMHSRSRITDAEMLKRIVMAKTG
jgi:serine-type D-Ala-D-Ala endopeptidase (penicillin-binding protein 7)